MRWLLILQVFFAAYTCAIRDLSAGLAPEHILVVANGDQPTSIEVAREYVGLRQIPEQNLLTLTGISNVEQVSVDQFRSQILQPVLAAIQDRGLQSQIRCVAYSVELPTAIHVGGDIGDRKLPQILTPVASINSLTYLHSLTMARDIRYLDLNVNFYARRIGKTSADQPWTGDELKAYTDAVQRLELDARRPRSREQTQPADALRPINDPAIQAAFDVLKQLARSHPKSSELLYNLACSMAMMEKTSDALSTLKLAIDAGWYDERHAARDPDLKSLYELSEFKALLAEMKSVTLDVLPARGFRSDIGWRPNGDFTPAPEFPRYLLSTVLAVTTGRGTTTSEALAGLHRSAAADSTRPQGTVYYMRNGDIRSTTRERGFQSAVEKLKALGVDATVEEGVLPQKKPHVAGAMIGIADFNWPACESTISPGAIVEHLTSFGGVMTTGAGQTPLTEFLRHGAAGSSGTVTEPYALQAKFPNPFIHVHYASGVSLAEAFYLSVTGPYQLLIVGDPLCNPWKRDFTLSIKSPAMDDPLQGTIRLEPQTESHQKIKPIEFALFIDGKLLQSVKASEPLTCDTTKMTNGDHQLTVIATGNDLVESIARWTSPVRIENLQSK